MLTFRSIAAGAISEASAYTAHLLERTLPEQHAKIAAYYGRGEAMDMGSIPIVRADIHPELAKALCLDAEALTEEQLAAVLSGRRADGTEIEGDQQKVRRYKTQDGKDRHRISGLDLCFSAPKSVSVAWAFATTDAEQNSIVQAHRDARDAVLRYIEREVAWGRRGKAGKKGVEKASMGWISIDHFTARPTRDQARRSRHGRHGNGALHPRSEAERRPAAAQPQHRPQRHGH